MQAWSAPRLNTPLAHHVLVVAPCALVVGPRVYPRLLVHLNRGAVGGQHVGVHHQEAGEADRKRAVDHDGDKRDRRAAQKRQCEHTRGGVNVRAAALRQLLACSARVAAACVLARRSPAAWHALEEREHRPHQARDGHDARGKRVDQEQQEELVVEQAHAVHDLQQVNGRASCAMAAGRLLQQGRHSGTAAQRPISAPAGSSVSRSDALTHMQ